MDHAILVLLVSVLWLMAAGCQRVGPESGAGPAPEKLQERSGVVTVRGKPLTLVGPDLAVGQKAPDFVAVDIDQAEVRFSSFRGKTVVLSSVPSLDTAVCDRETRRFNELAGKMGDDVVVLTVSMDLPFAQKRWCGNAGIDRVKTLSDYRDASFGRAYGVLIKETRLLARTVFVVDPEGVIRYRQIVDDLSHEPDYDAVLAAVDRVRASAH